MNITATVEDDKLKIEVAKTKTTLEAPYQEDKTYIANILTFFPSMGVVDFESMDEDKDHLVLKKLCEE
jgi:hypothetical protein